MKYWKNLCCLVKLPQEIWLFKCFVGCWCDVWPHLDEASLRAFLIKNLSGLCYGQNDALHSWSQHHLWKWKGETAVIIKPTGKKTGYWQQSPKKESLNNRRATSCWQPETQETLYLFKRLIIDLKSIHICVPTIWEFEEKQFMMSVQISRVFLGHPVCIYVSFC